MQELGPMDMHRVLRLLWDPEQSYSVLKRSVSSFTLTLKHIITYLQSVESKSLTESNISILALKAYPMPCRPRPATLGQSTSLSCPWGL